jgi:hypothetical protein
MWLGFNDTTGANLYPGIFRAQIEYRNAGKREAVFDGNLLWNCYLIQLYLLGAIVRRRAAARRADPQLLLPVLQMRD